MVFVDSIGHIKTNSGKEQRSCINKEEIISHLTKLGLDYERHLDKPLGNLSGGQRQILAFAMATLYKPRLLLLDEPTAALDDQSSHQLMKLIKKLVSTWDIPALMISHDHSLNLAYADSIIVLQDGLCRPAQHKPAPDVW